MTKVRTLSVVAVIAMTLTGSLWVFAQDDTGPAGKGLAELWDDFIHYVKISRPELAQSYAQALLDNSSEAMVIYKLYINTDNVETHLARAERMSDEMGPLVARLRLVIDGGYLELRADPEEIANSIELLAGGARAYARGSDRLVASGEYAMPQLVQKLMDPGTDPQLYERIVAVLPKLGRDAVRPLSVALQTNDEKLQKIIAEVLELIEYPHAVPRLRELYDDPETLPRVKGVLERTIVACGGSEALTKPLANLYYDAALDYYNRQDSILPDPRYDESNVWFWEPTLGVVFKKTPRAIFCDVYAMRMAELAWHHDPHFEPAVSLWLAAALRREIDLPGGATDPLWPTETPPASFYARGLGAGYAQQVLARALKDHNADLAVEAIRALADTAGSESLIKPLPGGAQPLVEALTYPNRRVRYWAAVSLARALPSGPFVGSPVVLNVLNEALRQRGGKTALLVASDQTQNNLLKAALRGADFEVLEHPTVSKAVVAGVQAGGVDVLVIGTQPSVFEVLGVFRSEAAYSVTPVVVCAAISDQLRDLAETDGRLVVIGPDDPSSEMRQAIGAAAALTAGPALSDQEVSLWAVKASQAIKLLGMTGNPTFDLSRSLSALTGALMSTDPAVRVSCAEALSVLDMTAAQQGIVALAVDVVAAEPVRISALHSLASSVRRFGNDLTDEQEGAIVAIVTGNDSHALREAAAQVLGALDLPSDQVRPLILQADPAD